MAMPDQAPATNPVSSDVAGRILPGSRAPGEVSEEPTPAPEASESAESTKLPSVSATVEPRFDLILERGVHTRTVVFTEEPTSDQIDSHRAAAEAEFDRIGETPPILQDRRVRR